MEHVFNITSMVRHEFEFLFFRFSALFFIEIEEVITE